MALAVVAASLLVLAAPEAGAVGPPHIIVEPGTASVNQRVTVSGKNFPPDTDVQMQICGNQALNGSADCVQSTSQEVSTTNKGLVQVPLVVTIPPKPCPCVVMALDFSAAATPTTPITIIGAPVAAPKALKLNNLQVKDAYLEGNGPWTAWFGASPQRTLVITVRNPNPAPYANPPLVLRIGQTDNTTTKEATVHNLATIGPDQTQTYKVPVSFPALAIGEHEVVGRVGDSGLSVSFTVQTWLFPWGLLIVALIVLEILLLLLTRYIRERRRKREEEEGKVHEELGPPTPPDGVPAVGALVGAAAAGADGAAGDGAAAGNGSPPTEPVPTEAVTAETGSPTAP